MIARLKIESFNDDSERGFKSHNNFAACASNCQAGFKSKDFSRHCKVRNVTDKPLAIGLRSGACRNGTGKWHYGSETACGRYAVCSK